VKLRHARNKNRHYYFLQPSLVLGDIQAKVPPIKALSCSTLPLGGKSSLLRLFFFSGSHRSAIFRIGLVTWDKDLIKIVPTHPGLKTLNCTWLNFPGVNW
jgi:hypothetical protein